MAFFGKEKDDKAGPDYDIQPTSGQSSDEVRNGSISEIQLKKVTKVSSIITVLVGIPFDDIVSTLGLTDASDIGLWPGFVQ